MIQSDQGTRFGKDLPLPRWKFYKRAWIPIILLLKQNQSHLIPPHSRNSSARFGGRLMHPLSFSQLFCFDATSQLIELQGNTMDPYTLTQSSALHRWSRFQSWSASMSSFSPAALSSINCICIKQRVRTCRYKGQIDSHQPNDSQLLKNLTRK